MTPLIQRVSSIQRLRFAPAGEGERPEGASGAGRNRTIEGMRGFSALIVMLYHVHNMAMIGQFYHPPADTPVELAIHGLGPFGVLLFFMISGYLIVQSLVKYDDILKFLKYRVIRIYPVFLFLNLIMFTFGPWANYAWMGALKHSAVQYALQFTSNLLLLPGVFPLPIAQKAAWSLSYEFTFYLIASVLYFAAVRRGSARAVRLLAWALGLTAGIAFVWMRPMAAYFLIGVVLCFAQRRWPAPLVRLSQSPVAGLLLLLGAFAFYVLQLMPMSLLLGLLFFSTIVREDGWFSLWLRAKPWQYLGRISYSLYLVHPFVLDPARSVMRLLSPHLQSEALSLLLFGIFGMTGAVLLASLMYRGVEIWFTNRYLRRRPQPRTLVSENTAFVTEARPAKP